MSTPIVKTPGRGLSGRHVRATTLMACTTHSKAKRVFSSDFGVPCSTGSNHAFTVSMQHIRCDRCKYELKGKKCGCWFVVSEPITKVTMQPGLSEPACKCKTVLNHDTTCAWVAWARANGKWWE